MGTHPIFESDFDCLTDVIILCNVKMEEGVSWVRAVDSFIAQNETDLGFKEGDLIQLLRFADENWAVGKLLNGNKQGIFPICFTEPHKGPPPPFASSVRPINESDRNNG